MRINIKTESEDSDNQGMFEIDQNAHSNKKINRNYQYQDKKIKLKKKLAISNRINDHPKNSVYSSSSKLTSFIKGNSISEAQITPFKSSESVYYNQLTEKYLSRGAPPDKIKEQMELALERKTSEIQALRVHRDQLKFISYNNPYDMPIKISLSVLKEKARTQVKIKDMMMLIHKDIKEIDFEFNTMTDYYNFVSNSLKSNGDDDLIIDTHEEEKLMIQNLQKQTNHLFRELKEEDKKNAKEIKSMQDQIATLRVYIKQKEDKIRDLKSKICTMHIKLHSRVGSSSKEKNLSLSIRKFISEQNNSIQEAFIGNKNFKHYSKELLEKVTGNEELVKIYFYYDSKKEIVTFKCVYKTHEGKMHNILEQQALTPGGPILSPVAEKKTRDSKQILVEVKVKYLLSMKFYFKSKIVGVECRLKTEKGNEHVQIGNCSSNLEHQLLTLINKKIVTLGSFWHQKQMIGVGVWYSTKLSDKTGNTINESQKDSSKQLGLRNARSARNLARQKETFFEYYNN